MVKEIELVRQEIRQIEAQLSLDIKGLEVKQPFKNRA